MPYYLKLHFDPDAGPENLRPKDIGHGQVDQQNLGYVQNAVQGQTLAELVEISKDDATSLDQRFIFDKKILPVGANTDRHPEKPEILIATMNGQVSWKNGRVNVQEALHFPGDIDYHTGNILFVGDVEIGGDVRSGFEVRGRNILVDGTIEAARVVAMEQLVCKSGIKGGNRSLLESSNSMEIPFCENARLRSGRDIRIAGSSYHSELYVGNNLEIQGRCIGGTYFVRDTVYVHEALGGGMGAETRLVLGLDPTLLLKSSEILATMRILQGKRAELLDLKLDDAEAREEISAKLMEIENRQTALRRLTAKVWQEIGNAGFSRNCRIMVPGEVRPGVEICIGGAYLKVDDYLSDVHFRFENKHITIGHPAVA